ncbi:MAG: Ldh family oxidoreductase, partial [Spirochaetaceae bacterium]|nr:Ldh family oxidoreductase [Spirochaetaceae bacterium]
MAPETRYSYETLHAFSIAVLTAAGAPDGHAGTVADHLVDANLAGHDSHGAHRLMQYTDAIDQGGIDPQASPRTVSEGTTTAVLDATGVFGQVAGLAATELAIAKACEHGTAVVGVRGANHVGRAGVYALKMAEAGLVGQVFCSGRGAGIVAPWGGTTPLLSTNPIAVAVPTAGDPILVDITTSVTAEGKVRVARYAGKELAPGQILDRDGNPSTRPDDLYNGGSMLPLGGLMGHKGYGLSVVVDLLGALLTGGSAGGKRGGGFSNNLTLWAADPDALGG